MCIKTVSAWSVAVCPSAIQPAPQPAASASSAARRARRARAGSPAPTASSSRAPANGSPRRAASASTCAASSAELTRSPWSTWPTASVTSKLGASSSITPSSASESGPPEQAISTRSPLNHPAPPPSPAQRARRASPTARAIIG
jgi:hypothetical protein